MAGTNEYTVLKFDFANHTNLRSEITQRAPQVIFDVIKFPLQQFARRQQNSSMLAGGSFDVDCLEQPDPHHLGDSAGVVPVGFVDAYRERCMHMPGLDTDRREANVDETGIDPLG
jgi:hypothetical protein